MAVATFDTLKFANTLKTAGVPSQQAEAQAVAFAEVIQLNLKELVTKDDLTRANDDLRKDLKAEVRDVEVRLAAKIDGVAADLKATNAQLRGELGVMRWMLGLIVFATVGTLVRLFVFRGGS